MLLSTSITRKNHRRKVRTASKKLRAECLPLVRYKLLQEFGAGRYPGACVRSRNDRAMHCENPTRQSLLDARHHAATKFMPDMNSNSVLK